MAAASTERQFTAFACLEAKGPISEYKYTPLPLGAGDVEINIAACGVCHSDLHQVNNDWKSAHYPLVCGHEIIGEVAALGSGVTHLRVGQRVGYTPQSKNCGKCVNCEQGKQQYCFNKQFNYASATGDARQPYTFGGFAHTVRADASWAFPIPDALPTVEAAPLLCAGLTTWSPFVHAKVKRGDKVGVVGMGGLGHIAVQFGVALGAEVTCISTSADKAEDAKKFGAVGFCNIKNADDRKANSGKFSFLLSTISADGVNWDQYLDLLATDGSMCVVGMPSSMTFSPGALVFKRASIFGSLLASKEEIVAMLEFSAKHKISALSEAVDMNAAGCNLALKKVHDNTARYRMVLVNRSFTSLNGAAATAAATTPAPATQ